MVGTLPILNGMFENVFDIFDPKRFGRPIFPYAFKKAIVKNPDTQVEEEVLIIEIAVVGCSNKDVTVTASGNLIKVTATAPPDPENYVTYYDYSFPVRLRCSTCNGDGQEWSLYDCCQEKA